MSTHYTDRPLFHLLASFQHGYTVESVRPSISHDSEDVNYVVLCGGKFVSCADSLDDGLLIAGRISNGYPA